MRSSLPGFQSENLVFTETVGSWFRKPAERVCLYIPTRYYVLTFILVGIFFFFFKSFSDECFFVLPLCGPKVT